MFVLLDGLFSFFEWKNEFCLPFFGSVHLLSDTYSFVRYSYLSCMTFRLLSFIKQNTTRMTFCSFFGYVSVFFCFCFVINFAKQLIIIFLLGFPLFRQRNGILLFSCERTKPNVSVRHMAKVTRIWKG